MQNKIFGTLAILSVLVLPFAGAHAAVFAIQEVPGSYGDLRVNDSGQIAGMSYDSNYLSAVTLWDSQLDPQILFSVNYGSVRALNNHGQVVGGVQFTMQYEPFSWSPATGLTVPLTSFGGAYSEARAVNDLGHVVGFGQDAGFPVWRYRPFLWTPTGGSVELLPGRTDLRYIMPNDINNAGTIVGSFVAESQICCGQAFRLDPNGNFHVFPGFYTTANAINESGDIAGSVYGSFHEARIFKGDGSVVTLGTLGGSYSIAYDINNNGEAVGESSNAAGEARGFYWSQATGMVELPTLGGHYARAGSISNTGIIGGLAQDAAGVSHGVVWKLLTSPADLVDGLGDTVEGLLSGGTLTATEAGSLGANLDQAAILIQKGKTEAASNMLVAFENKVHALVSSGRLSSAQAEGLLDAAEDARDALE